MKTSPFERSLQPIVLTAAAIAIGIAIAVATNVVALAIYAVMLAVPLFLLWVARDTPTLEERIAVLDAERDARRRRATAASPAALPKAA